MYLRVARQWTYLYRAVDSTGATIDFLLAKPRCGCREAVLAGHPLSRVINVDGNPPYPKIIAGLKKTGELGRRCRTAPSNGESRLPFVSVCGEKESRASKY